MRRSRPVPSSRSLDGPPRGRFARLHRPEPRLPLSLRVVVPQQQHPRKDGGAVGFFIYGVGGSVAVAPAVDDCKQVEHIGGAVAVHVAAVGTPAVDHRKQINHVNDAVAISICWTVNRACVINYVAAIVDPWIWNLMRIVWRKQLSVIAGKAIL